MCHYMDFADFQEEGQKSSAFSPNLVGRNFLVLAAGFPIKDANKMQSSGNFAHLYFVFFSILTAAFLLFHALENLTLIG